MPVTINGTTGVVFPDGVTQGSGVPTASGTSGAPLVSNGTIYTQNTAVAVAFGGTGATDAGTARSNLGTNDAANITTGTLSSSRLPTTGVNAASITTGTLAVANGGTGATSTPSNGQIPIGNGTNYTPATITAGTGITVTNGSGSITIASSGGGGGGRGQVFTSSGTFTIPTGITAVKATIIGGGGGGGGATGQSNGGAGGNSSIQSGTQSITTVTSNGGSGGLRHDVGGAGGSGGTTTNATLGYTGGKGSDRDGSRSGGAVMGSSTGTFNGNGSQYVPSGPWGSTGNVLMGITPSGQGNGGGGYYVACETGGGGGGAGGLSYVWLTGLTSGNTIGVTVGSGGASGGGNAQAGRAGIVIIEW